MKKVTLKNSSELFIKEVMQRINNRLLAYLCNFILHLTL